MLRGAVKGLGIRIVLLAVAMSGPAGRAEEGLQAAQRSKERPEMEPPKEVLRVDFETTDPKQIVAASPASTAVLTTDKNEMVAGKRSMKGDARASNAEWNEFFHSRQGLFQPKEAYHVSFEYRVLARSENAKFYALFRRSNAGGSAGWKEWQGDPGAAGHVDLTFATRNAGDYYLIIGIQNRGALAINNLLIRTDPANRPLDIRLPEPKRSWKSPGHSVYYLDSARGDDARDGKSVDRAWRSLARVNAGEFGPGDRILLRSGSRWQGFLSPGGSGTEDAPIQLDRYGEGPKPCIDAEGSTLATLYLFNVEYWEIHNLDIANRCKQRPPGLTGVQARLEDFGTAHHLQFQGLDVHDVTGSNVKAEGGGSGIHCVNGGRKVKSRFDGLRIENCHLQRTDRNGITMSGYWARQDWYPSLHVVIRKNLLEDIGGDGIVPTGCDGALVEHNLLRGGRRRCEDHAAGIWPWSCDNTTLQFNEVSGMRGTRDGQGYDADWNCRNTLFQYNYSHDNEGGFLLICNDGGSKMPWNIGNIGTVIRYNISQNDGARTFQITGPCRDTQIYNNVIYIGKGQDIHAVQAGNWGGAWPENTRFSNNIFYSDGKARFEFGGMQATVFENNVFWGSLQNRPEDSHAITADPKLSAPGHGKDGLESLQGYHLLPDSPCIRSGKPIPDSGGRDFWGHATPSAGPPDVGASQSK